ncbi:MAG: ABC transporter permease, partial [Chloroflexaceae bacterium]|nr:ABC transporter permease [Chloroflexaceae bacterium]
MQTVFTITWLTFHEARRRRMVLAALLLGAVFLGLFSLGFWFINREMQAGPSPTPRLIQQQGYNFLIIAGLYVVHFLTIMLSIFASVDTVSGEIASHTIHTIATKPIRRWQIILGKWLGYAMMISMYLVLLGGGIFLSAYVQSQYLPPNPLQGLALVVLEALVLLAVSLLLGTVFSTLTNGVALFMLYGLAFVGAWVEQIGAVLESDAAVRIGIISSLIMPVEALWRRAANVMQPPLMNAVPTPFSLASVPSTAMVIVCGRVC